jgi:glycosyltransferase involved in cell wall biosynthesis
MKTISVIIPTYNRATLLELTINSFLQVDYPQDKIEIIISDNNSSDGTKEVVSRIIEKEGTSRIRYVFEPRQGVHYARNTASFLAKFEILYFTDDDMIADINIFNEINNTFIFDNNIGAVTGKVLPIWEVSPPSWISKHCNNYLLSLLNPKYDFLISESLDYLYSCHQAIRKDVFFKAEGFNPEYTKDKYMGDGESGLNNKIKTLGYKFGYNGKSLIYHMIPSSRFTQSYLNKRFENNGRAHSYGYFKIDGSRKILIKQILLVIILKIPFDFLKSIILPLIKNDVTLFRFLIGKIYYWYGYLNFSLSILTNSKFRCFVLKKDWLTNGSEFDNVKI